MAIFENRINFSGIAAKILEYILKTPDSGSNSETVLCGLLKYLRALLDKSKELND